MPRRLGLVLHVLHVLGTAGAFAWIATHVEFFHSNYLPGAVAGDVGRGALSHPASETEGALGALPVARRLALGTQLLIAVAGWVLLVVPGPIDFAHNDAPRHRGACRAEAEQMAIGRPLGERLPIAGGHGHGGEFIENAGPTSIFGHKQP
jgi:hypothetical protein